MTVLQGVLAGARLVAVLIGLLWRLFAHFDARNESRIEQLDTKNERAHAAISENIKAVDERAERRAEAQRTELEAQRTELEAQRTALEAMARDVAFLAGRQAERDQQAEQTSG